MVNYLIGGGMGYMLGHDAYALASPLAFHSLPVIHPSLMQGTHLPVPAAMPRVVHREQPPKMTPAKLSQFQQQKEADSRGPCVHCHVTETPQWRDGPYGLKTACNACGIKYKRGNLPGFAKPDSASKRVAAPKKRRVEEISLDDSEHEYTPLESDISEPESVPQGPKRRKIKTPAYLKEDFVTVGITVDQLGSPDTPVERGIRSVLGAYTPSSEARSEAAGSSDLGAHGRVLGNFGASGDLQGREWEPFFGKDLLQNKNLDPSDADAVSTLLAMWHHTQVQKIWS